VVRDYPEDCGFIPAVNKNGDKDTKILIKIGFDLDNKKDDKVGLTLTASKFSRYAENHFGYDFNDEASPTKESLDASNKSLKPIDLEEKERYILNLKSGQIIDRQSKDKIVTMNEVVEDFYKQHLSTIKGIKANLFKIKLKTKEKIWHLLYGFIERTIKNLEKLNQHLFGKSIIKNSSEGIWEPYKCTSLTSTYPDVIPFFNSTLKISKVNIIWIAITLLVIWFKFISIRDMNETFTIALLILLVLFFDFIVPRFVLFIINLFIKLRKKLGSASFFFKTKF
jgi:hypothetical protein